MGNLANCLQKSIDRIPKDPETGKPSRPVLDHLMKRGLIAEAHRLVVSQGISVHEAEVRVVTEMRDKAVADSAKVDASLKAPKAQQAQASARRPVERDKRTQEEIDLMHATPAESIALSERLQARLDKVREKTRAMQANLPPVASPVSMSPQQDIEEIDKKEQLAEENLAASLEDAKQKVSEDIAAQYADRINNATDPVKRKHFEALAETARTNRVKAEDKIFAEKKRAVKADFTRQRQVVKAKARDASLRATEEGKRTADTLEHVRAFSEMNAIIGSLPPEVRQSVGGATTLATLRGSGQSIENFLATKISQVDAAMESNLQDVYTKRIETLLKTFKPKRSTAGVMKSRVGADAQDVVDRVTRYTKMPMDKVIARMHEIEAALADPDLTPEQQSLLATEQMELDTFGDTSQMTASQLAAAHASLKQTIGAGKAAWGASEEARLADMRAKADEIKAALPHTPAGAAETNRHQLTNWIKNFARNHGSFVQILSWLFPKASFISEWQSEAIKRDLADVTYQRGVQDRLIKALKAATGMSASWRIGEALQKMDKAEIPVPAAGGMATQREAIQYLFAWNQPKVQARMREQGWTDDHIRILADATNNPAANALKNFILNEYEAIYRMADPVYMRLYGMHLPRIEGQYAPMRYHAGGATSDMSMTGAMPASGVTPSALKSRTTHKAQLRQVDALQVFTEHVAQMSHWIHMAEFIRETKGVMGNADVKMGIEQSVGSKGLGDLQKHLDSVTRNGVTRAGDVAGFNGLIRHITGGVAVAAMAFNMHSVAMQNDSIGRWMAAIPMQRWGNVLLMHKWLALIPQVWRSDAIQQRVQGGMDPVTQYAMQRDKMTPVRLLNLTHLSMWAMNYFDGAMTTISSAIVLADALSQKDAAGNSVTLEQATDKMTEAIARFSQPTTITSKAQALATGGPAYKMLLMFAADPMLKTMLTYEGVQDIRAGRLEEGFRKIIAVEIWAMMAQTTLNIWAHVASGGSADPPDEPWLLQHWLRTLLMAPLQGIFVLGNVGEAIYAAVTGEKLFPKSTATGALTADVGKAARHLKDIPWHDLPGINLHDPKFWKEIDNVGRVLSEAGGGAGAAGYGAVHQGKKFYDYMEGIK